MAEVSEVSSLPKIFLLFDHSDFPTEIQKETSQFVQWIINEYGKKCTIKQYRKDYVPGRLVLDEFDRLCECSEIICIIVTSEFLGSKLLKHLKHAGFFHAAREDKRAVIIGAGIKDDDIKPFYQNYDPKRFSNFKSVQDSKSFLDGIFLRGSPDEGVVENPSSGSPDEGSVENPSSGSLDEGSVENPSSGSPDEGSVENPSSVQGSLDESAVENPSSGSPDEGSVENPSSVQGSPGEGAENSSSGSPDEGSVENPSSGSPGEGAENSSSGSPDEGAVGNPSSGSPGEGTENSSSGNRILEWIGGKLSEPKVYIIGGIVTVFIYYKIAKRFRFGNESVKVLGFIFQHLSPSKFPFIEYTTNILQMSEQE